MAIKTRDTVFLSLGSLMLLSIGMSKFNKQWLWLGGFAGAALVHAGYSGFCTLAYLLEKAKLTEPEYGHYEREKLKDINKTKVVKKIKEIRKEISNYVKEIEANKGISSLN